MRSAPSHPQKPSRKKPAASSISRVIQPAPRRPAYRRRGRSRNLLNGKLKAAAVGAVIIITWIVWAIAVRHLAPTSNTSLNRFDTIVVLGNPADADGNPSPTQLARVTEAVHEYERGVAPRMIVTGGAVANDHVEAQVMARTAEAQGVPASAVVTEPDARDTIQNACFATRIMQAHGWTSAEVVSSSYQLPRAGVIFNRLPILWRSHASPALRPPSTMQQVAIEGLETLKTMRYLVWARWREQCRL